VVRKPYTRLMVASAIAGSDLVMEFRVGRSGLGDDWLYRYTPDGNWTLIGRYLEGVNSECCSASNCSETR
jgi:hypothetical protein